MALETIEKKNFISILSSDATFRKVVPEGTEGATVREYETSTGEKGTKCELIFQRMRGMIGAVSFVDTDFGKLLQIEIDGDTLSLSTAQAFGEDFMKKLPNIDLKKEVVLSPYNFDDEKGKNKKGLTVYQDENKIENYFYDTEKKEVSNGYPAIEGDTKSFDSDDWKIYFMKARKFLIAYTAEHFVKNTVVEEDTVDSVAKEMEQAF